MNLIPLNWSEPKVVNTRNGKRNLRVAPVSETFWQLWRDQKQALKDAGYSVGKNTSGVWEVCHWGQDAVTPEQMKKEVETLVQSRATDANVELPVPEGLAYLPYQRAGIAFGVDRDAILIADEMGLGKTIQAIGIVNTRDARRVLVVCPASLRLNWKRECEKWLVADLRVDVVTSKDAFPRDPQVVVINYDILKKFHRELRAVAWDVVVMDEAHYCKNSKAQRTHEAFGRKANKAKKTAAVAPITGTCRVLLTGTPLKNRPIELFSLLNYLDEAAWPNLFTFAKRYCNAHQNGFGWDFSGASNLDELQHRLRSTVMVRRLKKDVLTELPAKQRQVISVEANGNRGIVDAEIRAYEEWEAAKASGDVKRLGIAATELAEARLNVSRAKVGDVIEHLLNCDEKVVVMCRHHEIVNKIIAALQDDDRKVVSLTGKNKLEDRQAAVDAFQNDASVQYFVGTIGAAGVGITLTAASHVVFAELEWTPGDLTQAEDRCHRIGQRDSVLVQHVVLDGSLDDRMLAMIIRKQKVADKTLDVEHAPRVEEPQVTFTLPPTTGSRRQDAAEAPKTICLPQDAWKDAEEKAKAAQVPQEKVEALHRAVRVVAGMCDGARELDGQGFNGTDANFGASLARQESLSQGQARSALKMMRKYKRQLPGELYTSIYGEAQKSA